MNTSKKAGKSAPRSRARPGGTYGQADISPAARKTALPSDRADQPSLAADPADDGPGGDNSSGPR